MRGNQHRQRLNQNINVQQIICSYSIGPISDLLIVQILGQNVSDFLPQLLRINLCCPKQPKYSKLVTARITKKCISIKQCEQKMTRPNTALRAVLPAAIVVGKLHDTPNVSGHSV